VARAAGVSRQMVAAGVAELEAGGEPLARARRPGGGRKKLAGTDPGLRPALLALVDPGSRGTRSRRFGGQRSRPGTWPPS
jgi:hypothetical protein